MVKENKGRFIGTARNRMIDLKNSATKSELILIDKILEMDFKSIVYLSITELADLTGIAEATIVRFCHKLDYKGYQDFKLHLSQEMTNTVEDDDDFTSSIANDMIGAINESKQAISVEMVEQISSIVVQKKRVCIFALGNSGISATSLRFALIKAGITVVGEVDSHIQSYIAANTTKDDIAIFISVSGSTKDIIEMAKMVKQNGTPIVSITNHFKSPLVHLSDYVLFSARKEAANRGGSIATIVSQHYMIDVLCSKIIESLGDQGKKNIENSSNAVSDKLL